MEDQRRQPASHFGPSVESTLLTLAVLGVVVVLLSALMFVRGGSSAASVAAGNRASSSGSRRSTSGGALGSSSAADNATGDQADSFTTDGGGSAADGSMSADGTDVSGDTVSDSIDGGSTDGGSGGGAAGGTAVGGGSGATKGGGGTATSPTGGTSGGTGGGSAGGGGVKPGAPDASCSAAGNGGSTDTGVSGGSIVLGAVTVDSGVGASFLQPEDVAMQAVARRINSSGGICGRQISLKLKDSGWNANTGFTYIQNLVEGDKVFALVVNPDSEGLALASSNGYLKKKGVPVIGTDGLLYSQYQDPMIWPIAASTVTAMHAIALSQYKSTMTNESYSLVYEKTYRFGREGANAYNRIVREKTGSDITGYVDPNTGNGGCPPGTHFCGIEANKSGYGTEVNAINSGCNQKCTAGVVLLEPTTAGVWFQSSGRFGGVADPTGGAGAAPQPLFARSFADLCKTICNKMRLWTGFLPAIEQFANTPGVQQYVNDMKAYSSSVDVNNQFAEGAYLGMRLAVDVMKTASSSGSGLTRDAVIKLLDSTSNYDIGLTVKPLSWRAGNHFAEVSVHAFDESYPAGFGGWQYVQGSQIDDPDPTHI